MQTPTSLISHMQSNMGTSLSSINCDGEWHSGNRSNGDPLGKISYIVVPLEKGCLVRYRCHNQGAYHVWKSWDDEGRGVGLDSNFSKQLECMVRLDVARTIFDDRSGSALMYSESLLGRFRIPAPR